tara:strand:- start:723 stop:1757 length:1035 start_codon:yes stop_codon:yes gene_type:complete
VNDYELDTLINRIISGYQFIEIKDNLYKLVSPTVDLKMAADYLYHKTYQDNLFSSFIPKEDIQYLLISTNMIPADIDQQIKTTEKTLENAKIQYYKQFFQTSVKTRNQKKIRSIEALLHKAYSDKQYLDFLTLEHYCENIKNEYLLCKTLMDQDDNLIFEDYPNINHILFNNIAQEIAQNIIPVNKYKQIVKSDVWRKLYNSNPTNVFARSASQHTEEQKAILSINQMYSKIYEHPECPDDAIIEDDDALDGWMLNQQKENQKQKMEKGVDNLLGKKGQKAQEVFLMAKNEEEYEAINQLNSPQALAKIKARTSLKPGETKSDEQFTDTQMEIRNRIAELNKKD